MQVGVGGLGYEGGQQGDGPDCTGYCHTVRDFDWRLDVQVLVHFQALASVESGQTHITLIIPDVEVNASGVSFQVISGCEGFPASRTLTMNLHITNGNPAIKQTLL